MYTCVVFLIAAKVRETTDDSNGYRTKLRRAGGGVVNR